MAIKFHCPECKKAFSVKDGYAGKKAKCKCGAKIVVPLVKSSSNGHQPIPVPKASQTDVIPQQPQVESLSVAKSHSNEEYAESIEKKSDVEKLQPKKKSDLIRQDEKEKIYGGVGRVVYFFGQVGLLIISVILYPIATAKSLSPLVFTMFATISFIVFILSFALIVNRLNNIGKSGLWSLLAFVPVANLYIGLICIMCPEGYQDTKKLDTAGKIIACIFFGFVLLLVVGLFLARRPGTFTY